MAGSKQAMALNGNASGAFTQATLTRLEQALVKERQKQDRSEDVRDIIATELDALTLMLLIEAALIPIALMAWGDLLIMVLYAGILSLVSFALLLAVLLGLERSDAQRSVRIKVVERELMDLRKAGKVGKK